MIFVPKQYLGERCSGLASMIQGSAGLVTDRVVPVFGCGVWLTGFRREVVTPDV
jgi:hypothetical protein